MGVNLWVVGAISVGIAALVGVLVGMRLAERRISKRLANPKVPQRPTEPGVVPNMVDIISEDYIQEVVKLWRHVVERQKASVFGDDDVRRGFYGNVADALANYELSLTMWRLAGQLRHANYTIYYRGQTYQLYDSLVPVVTDKLFEGRGADYHNLWNHYEAKLKNQLFLDVWHSFEDALRVIYATAVPADVQKRVDDEYRAQYANPEKAKVHLGIVTLWLTLLPKTNEDKAARAAHFKVIRFWFTARNTVHTNTFYNGTETDIALEVNGRLLQLIPNQPTEIMFPTTVLGLIKMLVDSFEFLTEHVKHDAKIPSRVSQLPQGIGWAKAPSEEPAL